MAIQEQITAIINQYGSTVVITPLTANSDVRGDITYTASSSVVTTKGVFDNFLLQELGLQRYGNLPDSNPILIMSSNEIVNAGDKIGFKTKNYNVISVEPFYLSDINLAIQCVLNESA